jgi:hypothetical protein
VFSTCLSLTSCSSYVGCVFFENKASIEQIYHQLPNMKCATLGGPHEVVSDMNRIHKTTFAQDRKIQRFRYIFILLVRWLMGLNILTLWLVKNYDNAWWTTMNVSKLSTLNCSYLNEYFTFMIFEILIFWQLFNELTSKIYNLYVLCI